ncbi:MAG TPA: enolase C-terminal domain-like protein, partial [Acetobacteraceae bacterium]|jgi:galactonate dehydratase|nr:enolase C-terminal domain-like protein [Acetobacteraceae bacterium]
VVAGAQVMMSVPNFYRLETSRWDLSKYNDFITEPLDNSGGRLKLRPKPGLGIEMNMDFMMANVVDGFGGA